MLALGGQTPSHFSTYILQLEQGAAVEEEPREIMVSGHSSPVDEEDRLTLSCFDVFWQDIQEYVSLVCSGFLANVSLVIQSCYDMFVKRSGSG